jgi:ATP-dependent protease ClpP protease subunit
MIAHYRKCTGLTEAKIREVLLPPQDVWLSSVEAKKLGLCDDVKDLK